MPFVLTLIWSSPFALILTEQPSGLTEQPFHLDPNEIWFTQNKMLLGGFWFFQNQLFVLYTHFWGEPSLISGMFRYIEGN